MTRLRVLAIDTSTEACSAALLWSAGEVRQRFTLTERGHADLILPMIDSLLAEAGCKLEDLDGLAFGRGPGGFTGLRIAAGVIQGLGYGAGLRIAPVSSLAAVAFLVSSAGMGEGTRGDGILVGNDARMNEVYWGCYRFDSTAPDVPIVIAAERVSSPDDVVPAGGVDRFAGNGIRRFPGLQQRLTALGLHFHDHCYPLAGAIAQIGAALLRRGESVAAADALPVYIRDEVARPAKPTVMPVS
jgi:tRNA threonylcarbamoyladenosine biosynthesis protein TsaB